MEKLQSVSNEHKKQAQLISFKIIYKDYTKRINEKPKSLQELKETIKKMYNLSSHKLSELNVYLLERSSMNFSLIGDKKYLNNEADYQSLISDVSELNEEAVNERFSNLCVQSGMQTVKLFLEISEVEEKLQNESDQYKIGTNNNVDNKIKRVVDSKFSKFEEKINSLMDNFSNSQNYSNIFKSVQNNEKGLNSKENNFSVFYSQCNICLQYPIMNSKYICLICDDIILCPNCENRHNHPVIKFKTPEFSSKEDICNIILSNNSNNKKSFKEILCSKQNFLAKVKDNFLHSKKYKVDIHMISDSYFIKKSSTYNIPLTLTNEGANSLPQDTYVYVKNCKDLVFNSIKVGKLFSPGEKVELELECQTGENLVEHEYLEIHVYQREVKIDYEPFIFKVKVCEKIYEDESNIFKSVVSFSPEDTVSTLPAHKKEVLSEIIRRNLSTKDILEICSILDKFGWKLTEEAVEEL